MERETSDIHVSKLDFHDKDIYQYFVEKHGALYRVMKYCHSWYADITLEHSFEDYNKAQRHAYILNQELKASNSYYKGDIPDPGDFPERMA